MTASRARASQVDAPRDPGYFRDGACTSGAFDVDLWSDDNRHAEAMHVCMTHCPILEKCYEWAVGAKLRGVVMGGVVWSDTDRVYQVPTVPAPYCELCVDDPRVLDEQRQLVGQVRYPHGTEQARRRHRNRGEPLCARCWSSLSPGWRKRQGPPMLEAS